MSVTSKVVVVEDDDFLREAIAEVFQGIADISCVGVFHDGRSALREIPGLKPDVIVMDVNLPDIGGVECVAELSKKLPKAKIVMLTVYQDANTLFCALKAGAHGYLVKPILPEKLIGAIRELREGGIPMSRTIARKVVDYFLKAQQEGRREDKGEEAAAVVEASVLGSRERQVLDLMVRGFSYKEIAEELAISDSTVSTYVQRIYEKLHVHSRREIVAKYGRG